MWENNTDPLREVVQDVAVHVLNVSVDAVIS